MGAVELDIIWIILCGFLVVLMQAGFTCLEGGLVRAKNSINVAIKNLIDFCISCVLFAAVGFGLMFGVSWDGWVGTTHFWGDIAGDPRTLVFFFFQMAFCGTATTIVSGAVAERMGFAGYILTSILLSGLLYPVIGHWAWAGADAGVLTGWLGARGFIDFAGSTVVHGAGGWMALAAILVIGPRLGRFGPEGRPIPGDNLPVATLGVFILWFGWFGFNAGSALALNSLVPLIIANTALAGAAGGISAMGLTWWRTGRPRADRVMNGTLGGLVGITACCHMMTPAGAVLVGAVGGLIAAWGANILDRLGIDDAVGAVPVHLFAGIWGTLAVALVAPEGSWGTGLGRWEQLLIQMQGVLLVGLAVFGVGLPVLWLLDRHLLRLRVRPDEEIVGLNVSEHGAGTALIDLLEQMGRQAHEGRFDRPVVVEPSTEAAAIAAFYNSVREKFNLEFQRKQLAVEMLEEAATHDFLTGLANRRLFHRELVQALARSRRTGRHAAVLYIDLDGFKPVNDRFGHEIGDLLLVAVARRIEGLLRETDSMARMGGDEFVILLQDLAEAGGAEIVVGRVRAAMEEPFLIADMKLEIGASIGLATIAPDHAETPESVLKKADEAMYAQKRQRAVIAA